MVVVLKWSMKRTINMITKILLNKFDCCIAIEGNRGLGKSTLAYHIGKGVAREMKKRGIEGYKFHPRHALLYQRKEVIRFFHKWKASGIADEMVNVTFNRDFYNEDQKDLIKMMNMNRDHCNLFVACIPHFQNLDSQVKNLMKIRFTVVRRGIAVVQTPNRSIYGKDKWDQAVNEKIEREWLKKGIQNPQYARLTTFRGILKFPPLSNKQEEIYQKVKDDKRNLVAKDQMGIEEEEEEKDPVKETAKMLVEGKIRNHIFLEGIAVAYGRNPEGFKSSLMNELKKQGKNHKLASYYWDKKGVSKNAEKIDKLVGQLQGKKS